VVVLLRVHLQPIVTIQNLRNNMKDQSKIIILSAVLISIGCCELSALAVRKSLPQNNCSDLQAIANKAWRGKRITFQGFENLPVQTDIYSHKGKGTDRLCQLGYVTSITPMGKQICKGYLYTNTEELNLGWGHGRFRSTFYDPENSESEYCRYMN
jgi:hypothetical protein